MILKEEGIEEIDQDLLIRDEERDLDRMFEQDLGRIIEWSVMIGDQDLDLMIRKEEDQLK